MTTEIIHSSRFDGNYILAVDLQMKSLLNSKQSVSKQIVVETYLSLQTHGDRMMDKQTFARVKKSLCILLLVFFVMSVTAAAASAHGGGWGRWGGYPLMGNSYSYFGYPYAAPYIATVPV